MIYVSFYYYDLYQYRCFRENGSVIEDPIDRFAEGGVVVRSGGCSAFFFKCKRQTSHVSCAPGSLCVGELETRLPNLREGGTPLSYSRASSFESQLSIIDKSTTKFMHLVRPCGGARAPPSLHSSPAMGEEPPMLLACLMAYQEPGADTTILI